MSARPLETRRAARLGTAERLGISRATADRRIKSLGIDPAALG